MTIELTPEQKRYVERQVATGKYVSESALMQQALEVLRRYDEKTTEIQEGYQLGLADLKAGRSITVSTLEEAEVFGSKIKQRGQELRAERKNTAR